MTVTLTHHLRPESLANADYDLPEYATARVSVDGPDYESARAAALAQVPEGHMVIVIRAER